MTTNQIKTAILTETMARLAEQIRVERNGLEHLTGIRALATERMLHTDERAYLAALADYRTINHAHATIPAGCGLH